MIDRYLEQFETQFKKGDEPAFLRELRQKGLERFSTLGFPTTKQEEWRYTNVAPLTQIPFKGSSDSNLSAFFKEKFKKAMGLPPGEIRLVFLNGRFISDLSSVKGLPQGVRVENFGEGLKKSPELFEKFLGRISSYEEYPFLALNTAFIQEGAFLFLPKGLVFEVPIHFMFVSDSQEEAIVSHPRNLIIAEEGAQAKIVETYWGSGEIPYFSNAVTEIAVGEHAFIEHTKIQDESEKAFHIASICAAQGRQSHLTSHSISLGGHLARNDITTLLQGEGAECQLNGLYLVQGEQHVDHHTNIEHLKPHGTSSELYKGILGGKAKGVFDGRIVVRPTAPKTSAIQTNKNLLLSDDAQINTRPLLEIFNNDVKCNHGATTGRLDENQVFYLRSRAIDLKLARSLLTYAFASEVVERMKIEGLKESLKQVLFSRLMVGEGGTE